MDDISEVFFYPENLQFLTIKFGPCDRITLHVPNDVVDMYKGMIPWNKFNIVGM